MVHSTVLFPSMFSDLDLQSENELSEVEFSGDEDFPSLDQNDQENSPLLDQNEQTPKRRIRQIPQNFNIATFNNEIDKDKEIPRKRCAVCCRLLYPEEYCRLSSNHKTSIEKMFVKDRQTAFANGKTVREIENINWPLLNYRDHNGEQIQQLDTHLPKGKGGEHVIVCARHRSSGAQSLKTIKDYVC